MRLAWIRTNFHEGARSKHPSVPLCLNSLPSMDTSPRYAPQQAFPPYAFLPGKDPHPTQNPAGHSYTGKHEPPTDYFPSADWESTVDYLFGVDLYNHGYLWEAHEAWEGLWHPAKRDKVHADFLQGLIQCSAAALKVRMQQPRGVAKLAQLGTEKLMDVAKSGGPEFMGLDVVDFAARFRSFAASEPASPDGRPLIVLG